MENNYKVIKKLAKTNFTKLLNKKIKAIKEEQQFEILSNTINESIKEEELDNNPAIVTENDKKNNDSENL